MSKAGSPSAKTPRCCRHVHKGRWVVPKHPREKGYGKGSVMSRGARLIHGVLWSAGPGIARRDAGPHAVPCRRRWPRPPDAETRARSASQAAAWGLSDAAGVISHFPHGASRCCRLVSKKGSLRRAVLTIPWGRGHLSPFSLAQGPWIPGAAKPQRRCADAPGRVNAGGRDLVVLVIMLSTRSHPASCEGGSPTAP